MTSNDTDKANILIEDNVDWDATELLSAVSVDASNVSLVNAVGNFSIANLVGRYSANGYMGEAFTNLLVNPNAPASQDVVLVAGTDSSFSAIEGT